eukprot:363547-Chlamydomonas_euryale.AAC.9
MSEPANAAGAEEVRLFSKMDLARRAALVVARALCADDTLTLLSFSNGVEKRLARTHMHAAGLAAAERAIETLQPQLGTNLWGGLVHGLEVRLHGCRTCARSRLTRCSGPPARLPRPQPHLVPGV